MPSLAEKLNWVAQGKKGRVMCLDCALRDFYGTDTRFCKACHAAWREINGTTEYFNNPDRPMAKPKRVNRANQLTLKGVDMDGATPIGEDVKQGMERILKAAPIQPEIMDPGAPPDPTENPPKKDDPAPNQEMGLIPASMFNFKSDLGDIYARLEASRSKMAQTGAKMAMRMEMAEVALQKAAAEQDAELKRQGI